jgi:precorrin-6B methylase 1
MKVYFVGAGPGDPELLTRKAEKLLRACAVCIYAGSLVSPEVVALVSPQAEMHNSAAMDLAQTTAVCLAARERGLDVVRLHTGDPCLYGAINEQMDQLDRHGIDYEVVPGISAFQAAAAALKRELTAPEVVQTVILSRAGGRTPVPEAEALENLARTRATLCLYLSCSPDRSDRPAPGRRVRHRLPGRRGLPCLLARPASADRHPGGYRRKDDRRRHHQNRPDPCGALLDPRRRTLQTVRQRFFARVSQGR